MSSFADQLAWCHERQNTLAGYLRGSEQDPAAYPDARGAEQGWQDAVGEEVLILMGQKKPTDYQTFLKSKQVLDAPTGFDIDASAISLQLFPFQRDITRWAIRRGRAGVFADCGLGKTPVQLTWGRHVSKHTKKPVLIFAPLAVSRQTEREGVKFGIHVTVCEQQSDIQPGVNITNYEKLAHFPDASQFGGVVLDESSILKGMDGKTRKALTEYCRPIPFRLCCTATPAPNDYMELGNHAEFLGVMTCAEMLAMFFTHDGGDTSKWRIKGHAEDVFWKWVASWAVAIRKPSDLGYDDDGFTLPPIEMHQITVSAEQTAGYLFPVEGKTLQERNQARRDSITDRVEACAEIVNASDEFWTVWCNLNSESEALNAAIEDALEVQGSDTTTHKENAALEFSNGNVRVLLSKPMIFGFGMNWQHCSHVAFVGLSDSYEQFYQAVRRCWRFGQKRTVHCYVITAETEGAVVRNIKRKEQQAMEMMEGMVRHMRDEMQKNVRGQERDTAIYETAVETTERFTAVLGDCVEKTQEIASDSIDFTIFSPPFASLYTYSNSERDMGNSKNYTEFEEHFRFLVSELFRVTKPGRLLSFHCMNLPFSKERDGFIGIRDFRGDLIRLFMGGEYLDIKRTLSAMEKKCMEEQLKQGPERNFHRIIRLDELCDRLRLELKEYVSPCGWIFHSEVCIWKDPVTAMQRTKALGLLYKQLRKDSCMSRQGIPDYLVTMRKPGINPEPVTHVAPPVGTTFKHARNVPANEFSVDRWQNYASPVWMDINPSDTLQRESARSEDDERHICPLQLQVIERAIELWTNPNDLVFSPFMGIGSEGYVALQQGRRFTGIELKESYYRAAVANLKAAENSQQANLFTTQEEAPCSK